MKQSSGVSSCLPVSAKMSKAKKVLDEARETQNRELDLVDKSVSSFEELPGLCKFSQISHRRATLHLFLDNLSGTSFASIFGRKSTV